MEIPINPFFSVLLSFLSALVLFKLSSILIFSKKSSRWSIPPPGPWQFPLIGNMHSLIGSVPHRALHQLALKHGPLMQLRLGEVRVVIASSAGAAKEVMRTHDANFASRPPILAAEIMSYGCTSITFGPYGDYWRQLRKICTSELLSSRRVESFRSLREHVYLGLSEWVASMEGSPVNLTEKLYSSTYSFTATAAVGRLTEERERLLPIIREGLDLAAGFDIAEIYPSVKVFRLMSGVRRRLSWLHEKADELLERIIKQHREAVFINGDEREREDLLDVLLKFQDDGGLEIPLTNDNIKAVLLDMLGAGSETSVTTIDWAMAEMMKNPRVLKKAQDEARVVFDENGGFVDEALVPQLEYMKAVVKETLRLHPPVPLLLPRKCGETCQINGYEIPAETKVIVNAWAINRDPEYWENPDCFRPERFLDSSVDYKGNNFEYIPFGAGRRICPGMRFGIANVELPLAMFLYHFDWKLGDGIKYEEMDMTERFGITARRKKDLCLVPLIKRPLSLK
ncbi:hypothetical protein C2S51_009903 [Perilla frutescens var. frutescens]|nr:hypothetical protein C2S51_009903 [Perilla frutescens var. frutescens]